MTTTVAVIHPGAMGAEVGRCLVGAGNEVLWASAGRSEETVRRAERAGLSDVGQLRELVERAEVIISICPPHAALGVARSVAGFGGLYVDANAVSPSTSAQVADVFGESRYVDGGIIGPPPSSPDTTRLYLSGSRSEEVAQLLVGTALEARVLAQGGPAASSLKMAYASLSKAQAALILNAAALARAQGVEEDLAAEWARSSPQSASRLDSAARSASTKGWRWVGEMEEIASTMAAAGLPEGFHLAAAEIFRRSPRQDGAGLEQVLEGISDPV